MRGVRLKWECPDEETKKPWDGSIIANPKRPVKLMVYDGMDGELINFTHASTVGLRMRMTINYQWLCYATGKTTIINTSGDVLTGFMSGCYIATWTEQGKNQVAHVGTVDGNTTVNKRVKSKFATFMPKDTQGFDPASAWNFAEIAKVLQSFKSLPSMKIMALVTSDKRFYSILMLAISGLNNKEWVVGGIKKVVPKNYATLKLALK